MDKNVDIGRMGENIITNELLARGFLVTHLDKGTRGVSANADLLVGRPQLNKPVLIQVKASVARSTPEWVFFGGMTEAMLEGQEPVYNRKPGFKADFLATASIVGPKVYRTFILPIQVAEDLILRSSREWYANPTRAGGQRKVVPTAYVYAAPDKARKWASVRGQEIHMAAARTLITYEDRYEILLAQNA